MYPIVRIIREALRARRQPALPITGAHISHHRCWPQDIDIFIEMNNGRVMTIFDIGRTGLGERIGLSPALQRRKWGIAVAGSTVRYRKRIRPFVKFTMQTRCIGWDARFFYIEQSLWIGDTCAAHALLRTCVTDANGIVPSAQMLAELDHADPSPQLPGWAQGWIDADATRLWPPTDLRAAA